MLGCVKREALAYISELDVTLSLSVNDSLCTAVIHNGKSAINQGDTLVWSIWKGTVSGSNPVSTEPTFIYVVDSSRWIIEFPPHADGRVETIGERNYSILDRDEHMLKTAGKTGHYYYYGDIDETADGCLSGFTSMLRLDQTPSIGFKASPHSIPSDVNNHSRTCNNTWHKVDEKAFPGGRISWVRNRDYTMSVIHNTTTGSCDTIIWAGCMTGYHLSESFMLLEDGTICSLSDTRDAFHFGPSHFEYMSSLEYRSKQKDPEYVRTIQYYVDLYARKIVIHERTVE